MYKIAPVPVVALAVPDVGDALFGLVPAVTGVVVPQLVMAVGELALASVGAISELGELLAQLEFLFVGPAHLVVPGRRWGLGRRRGTRLLACFNAAKGKGVEQISSLKVGHE